MRTESYKYRNCPIPGGGYVTGFIFHERDENVLYCRTDIGGTYRYDYDEARWHSLIDHVTMEAPDETFPIALALDSSDSNVLYIACGVGAHSSAHNAHKGVLAVSGDKGETFVYHELPFFVHGNLNGRGTGYRLIVDKNDRNTLIMASQMDGLWTSHDCGKNWEYIAAFPEKYMTFVGQSQDGGVLIAAGAGVTTAVNSSLRGHSVYYSTDKGNTFIPLAGPEDRLIDGVAFAGYVAQRYAMDSQYLYITYAVMGRNAYVHELGYSCDGGSVIGGRIYRYNLNNMRGEEITPVEYPDNTQIEEGLLEYGFSGINCGARTPGLVIASTISKENGDCIYRSLDYGNTWECILYGLTRGVMDFRTSYMKPEFNGNANLIHWLSDLKINPFNENEAWFNTGTGVFRTDNLLSEEVHFSDRCDGIEETVHLNLYSPPAGEVQLIDILGDLGGFAFTDLNTPCKNSFADENGNRYITCINADYSDINPDVVIVTPRGNWTGKTKGGLIISYDGCKTFNRLDLPFGLSEELDKAFEILETPNVNSGWVAMSPDAQTIVWTVADVINLPISRVLVCHLKNDEGVFNKRQSFDYVRVYDKNGNLKTDGGFKVFSDRVDSNIFYGFGSDGCIYASTDRGDTFREIEFRNDENAAAPFPNVDFIKIDCANKTEIRVESGHRGHIYMALGRAGLWELQVEPEILRADAHKLSKDGDIVYRLGLGIGSPDGDYFNDPKALYVAATIDGEYGFYRSDDNGVSFVRLNTEAQMFGDINSLEADSRTYGRFFLATGSRGVVYGERA